MGKKVLFLTDFYYPNATSIGVCVDKLIREFQLREYEIHAVCFGEETLPDAYDYDGVRIHYVKKRIWDRCEDYKYSKRKGASLVGKVGKIMLRAAQIIHIFSYPNVSGKISKRYQKVAVYAYEKHSFEMVISSYAPIEAMLAGYALKIKYPSVYWVGYILDSFTNRGDSAILSAGLNDKLGWKWEKKYFKNADLTINMKCHEQHHNKPRYDEFKSKMAIADIPLMSFKAAENKNQVQNKGTVTFAYTGRISEMFYSPSYWIRLLVYMHKENVDYRMFFCGATDCEPQLREAEIRTDNKIIYRGLLSQQEAAAQRNDADILVNFGALNSDKIHSKIFEYMSLRKKIVHIQRGEKDSSVAYLKKYPFALILRESNDFETNYRELFKFVYEEIIDIDWTEVFDRFQENTPRYTCDLIERFERNVI